MVLHPTDFGRSIQNMLHVSFLVNEAKVQIFICPDTELPFIQPLSKKQQDQFLEPGVVIKINMQDWSQLVKGLKIETPMLD